MSNKMTHEQMVAVLTSLGLPSVARHLEALHRENIELREQADRIARLLLTLEDARPQSAPRRS
jgi:hypothetical protein